MRCRRPFLAALRGCLVLAVALSMGGCTLVDSSLSPRAFDINQGTQNARESGILLNIVRASRSEPLNFVALSRYTGTGSLGVNAGGSQNDLLRFGTPTSVATKGIFTSAVNVNAGNAFDVGTLENRDFYGGFLSPHGCGGALPSPPKQCQLTFSLYIFIPISHAGLSLPPIYSGLRQEPWSAYTFHV